MMYRTFCVSILLQTGSFFPGTSSYVFQQSKTATAFHRLRSSSSVSVWSSSSSSRSSTAEDTSFSTFADSLEESDTYESSSSTSTKTRMFKEDEDENEKPWQTKLDELVDPSTNLADRQILLSELLSSNDEIRDSVFDALTNRKLDPLLTPTQKKLQDGTRAVVRQLANDILPQITSSNSAGRPSPPSQLVPPVVNIETIGTRFFSAVTNQIQKNIEELQDDLTDPINKIPKRLERQRTELIKEGRNIFLEKPQGLEEPAYTVLSDSTDLYEIRSYEAYTVVSTKASNEFDDGMAAGSAFNTLASYIFGSNDESKVMSMTTPVTTTSSGDMRFYISPNGIDDGRIPEPSPSSANGDNSDNSVVGENNNGTNKKVEIVQIPSSTLAVRKFTGFVTDGEVARQKDTLLSALQMDGIELDVAHGSVVPHIIFQYNPPYTLPIVRLNEIGVPVRLMNSSIDGDNGDEDTSPDSTNLKKEWTVEDEDDDNDDSDDDLSIKKE